MTWIHGLSLAEHGYDFLLTNGDLFHSNYKIPLLGKIKNSLGIRIINNKYKKIRNHFFSAAIAKKIIKGKTVSAENKDRHLKKKSLGSVMLSIDQNKKYAQELQQIIEALDCSTSTIF